MCVCVCVFFVDGRVKALAARAKHIECCFMFALVWSLGSTGVEAGQRAFLDFLDNIVADLGVIENEWEGVNNALQVCTGEGGLGGLGQPRTEVLLFADASGCFCCLARLSTRVAVLETFCFCNRGGPLNRGGRGEGR